MAVDDGQDEAEGRAGPRNRFPETVLWFVTVGRSQMSEGAMDTEAKAKTDAMRKEMAG